MLKKLIVLSDWGSDSIYQLEFTQAINGSLQSGLYPHVEHVNTSSNTLNAGFLLQQTILTEERLGRPQDTIIFCGLENSALHLPLFVIRTLTGIIILGENYEYVFSFIKRKIEEVFIYSTQYAKTSFSSRDAYSHVLPFFLENREKEIDLEETHSNTIIERDDVVAAHIDVFGNIITTKTVEDVKSKLDWSENAIVTVSASTHQCRLVKNPLSQDDDKIYCGPSSWGLPSNPYILLATNLNYSKVNAFEAFGKPKIGAKITLS